MYMSAFVREKMKGEAPPPADGGTSCLVSLSDALEVVKVAALLTDRFKLELSGQLHPEFKNKANKGMVNKNDVGEVDVAKMEA